jgi:hypothetical protein
MNRIFRLAAIAALLASLGGCVVAPGPYGYAPGYAYGPAYPAPVVGVGGCFNCGFHRW